MELPRRGVWNHDYAKQWEFAMVSGNGKQGVMVFGNPSQETIIGNHCRLFLPKTDHYFIPDMAPYLKELRQIIKEQGYEAAQKFYYEKALALGYQGLQMSAPFHPGFHLHIQTDVITYQDYFRYENFENGEIGVGFTDQSGVKHFRKTFVSRAHHLIVHQIKNDKQTVSCRLKVEKYQQSLLKTTHKVTKEGFFLHHVYLTGGGGYDSQIKLIAPKGQVTVEKNQIVIKNACEVLLLMDIHPYLDTEQYVKNNFNLNDFPFTSYEELLSRHQPLHQALFNRSQLNLVSNQQRLRSAEELIAEAKEQQSLPLALIEKLYDVGKYMFICSAGELIPNLQGIWSGTFNPAWSSDFTFDTNVQLAIASALYCQLNEGLQGLFQLIKELIPEFRENAQKYYGCRGIMVAIHCSNSGKHVHWNEEWPLQFWTCGAGWLGHWYYDYYLHTGDKEFLRHQAIPYLKECALFYEDFLIEEDDQYLFSPSYSAENGCGDNATQDIAVAKEVLTHLIEAHQELEIETEDIKKWQAMLEKLPPYLINAEGALKEWAVINKSEEYNHRHFSQLYPVFQSREFTKESEPKLWQASVIALDKRLEAWMRNKGGDTSSSHGRMHAALCATRLNRPDVAYEALELMVLNHSMYPTLMTSHYNHYHIFNVDGNGAIPQIINEMLVYGDVGRLTLLGAIPNLLAKGSIAGISLPKQLIVKRLEWSLNDKTVAIKLLSGIDQEILLEVPLFPGVRVTQYQGCQVNAVNSKIIVLLTENKTAWLHLKL